MSKEFITQCCVCKKVKTNDHWTLPCHMLFSIDPLNISHGYCPECANEAFKQIAKYEKERQREKKRK